MKITSKFLRAKGACTDQINLFKKLGGDKKPLTRELCLQHASKFDWDWAAFTLLPHPARIKYQRARTPALAEYRRATAPAWAEYQRAGGHGDVAWAEYQRVVAPAWAEYKRAKAIAFFNLWTQTQ